MIILCEVRVDELAIFGIEIDTNDTKKSEAKIFFYSRLVLT